MIRKYERTSEDGVRGLGGPEVGRGLKQAWTELWIWRILSSPQSEVGTELPFRLMHPKPEEKNPAGQLCLVFALLR